MDSLIERVVADTSLPPERAFFSSRATCPVRHPLLLFPREVRLLAGRGRTDRCPKGGRSVCEGRRRHNLGHPRPRTVAAHEERLHGDRHSYFRRESRPNILTFARDAGQALWRPDDPRGPFQNERVSKADAIRPFVSCSATNVSLSASSARPGSQRRGAFLRGGKSAPPPRRRQPLCRDALRGRRRSLAFTFSSSCSFCARGPCGKGRGGGRWI